MYVCMHVYVFYISVCLAVFLFACAPLFIYLFVCIYAYLFVHLLMYAFDCMFACARVFACVYTLRETDSGAREREQRTTFLKRQTPWGRDPIPY